MIWLVSMGSSAESIIALAAARWRRSVGFWPYLIALRYLLRNSVRMVLRVVSIV